MRPWGSIMECKARLAHASSPGTGDGGSGDSDNKMADLEKLLCSSMLEKERHGSVRTVMPASFYH